MFPLVAVPGRKGGGDTQRAEAVRGFQIKGSNSQSNMWTEKSASLAVTQNNVNRYI